MSAVIAVAKAHGIELLTDAAFCWEDDGVVERFGSKQLVTSRCVLATAGWLPIAQHFAYLAKARCEDFDALIAASDELWRETAKLSADDGRTPVDTVVVLAGWSAKRRQLELHSIDTSENRLSRDLTAFATGPCDASRVATNAFVERFGDVPDSFDACRDGVALMEELRRYPRQFQQSTHPAVGGWVQRTVVTWSNADVSIIHRWPDSVGKPIELGAHS